MTQPASDLIRPLFLLSVQRSGSTLLQRMLATHPDIATVSEPWVLLPFMYTMRREGVYADYQHRATVAALEDFADELPAGMATYREELRRFALRLYRDAAGEGPGWFLDKSPRYAFIIDELIETFPHARFVVLWRNPLSVVSSVIETWGEGKWNVETHKNDLYDGLIRLVDGYERHESRLHALRYEDLVTDPDSALKAIFEYMGVPVWDPASDEFGDVELQGRMGDPTGVGAYATVSTEPLTKWRATLANPFRQAWSRRYLRIIGRDRLAVMGYDIDDLISELADAPTSMRGFAADIYRAGRGLMSSFFETGLLRRKLSRLPRAHEIHRHS